MFPLFELAKLLHFSSETQKIEQVATVRQIAWKEVGDRSCLALLFSNDYLLLRHATHGSAPVVRQLPWRPDRPVQCMTFDPSATWLLCVTQKDVLYVVPTLALMDPRAMVEPLWKVDDITRIKLRRRRGQSTCLTWWRTFGGDQVAIVGTKLGHVLFLDLQTERHLSEMDVKENISNIAVLTDDSQRTTHALITTKSNNQWRMLLETKDQTDRFGEGDGDAACFGTGSISILQYPDSCASEFALKRLQQFSSSTFLTPVTVGGKSMVAARDLHAKQLRLYDHSLGRGPCEVYVVPEVVDEVVVTDPLLFFSSTNEGSCLKVVANRLNQVLPAADTEDFNEDAVVQIFPLGPSERILALFKRSFPFYWHEERAERLRPRRSSGTGHPSADVTSRRVAPHVGRHMVLAGCLVVTTHSAYECRPRVSPEVLFVELALSQSESGAAERLAAALDLNVHRLYHLAARVQLSHQDYGQASRFFQLAKSPPLERVGAFAECGWMSEVVQLLRHTLACRRPELRPAERRHLADMMVLAYTQQLLDDKSRTSELSYQLRDFLTTNKHYSTEDALEVLVENGLYEIALFMGSAWDCLFEVLERVVEAGDAESLVKQTLHQLPHGKLDLMRRSPLLKYISPGHLVTMLEAQPSFALDFMPHFQMILDSLDVDTLQRVIPLYDISHTRYQKLMSDEQLESRDSNNCEDISGSVQSVYPENALADDGQENTEILNKLVNFFARCIILLNALLGHDLALSFTEDGFRPLYTKARPPAAARRYRLTVRRRLVSAGAHHSALVHNEQLYLWGHYCLQRDGPDEPARGGAAQSVRPEVETRNAELWRPYSPAAFRTLRVASVSCGAQHSMAITDDGVYGWGDCRYGQLGMGRECGRVVGRPQRVQPVIETQCVDVVCGNYHSVALMDDGAVCTWGWGIHGQLGHGDSEDAYVPKALSSPGGVRVIEIAAGYAHTLLLTETGRVYACGSGIFGQLGLGTARKHPNLQHVTKLPDDIISIATKQFHCVAVTSDSAVYQWGASPTTLCDAVREHRQGCRIRAGPSPAALGVQQHYLTPATVDTYNVVAKVVKVVCGNNFSALVTEDGEVFTWGRNCDGQLGIGNRTDQKYPVMVNRINDRKVASVGCGADHMVVMDTNHQVWSWGRNDLGQVTWDLAGQGVGHLDVDTMVGGDTYNKRWKRTFSSLVHLYVAYHNMFICRVQLAVVTSHGCGSAGGQGIYVSMGIYAAVWPTKVPSVNRITAHASGVPLRRYASTGQADGQWHLVLPPLAPYTCQTLFTVLQYLLASCDRSQWLHQCLDHCLWSTAASLALHQGALSIALHCHLKALSQTTPEAGGQCTSSSYSVHERLLLVSEFYIGKLEKMSQENFKVFVQTAQDILCQLGEEWVSRDLDVTLLTDIIMKHLEIVAWPFFMLMTRTGEPDVTTAPPAPPVPGVPTLPAPVVASLPVSFCLQVMTTVIHHLQKGTIPREDLHLHLEDLTLAHRAGGVKALKDFDLLPRHQSTAEVQLWEEVIRNIRNEASETQAAVTLSGLQLDALTADVQAGADVAGDPALPPPDRDTASRPGDGDTAPRPGDGDTAPRPGDGDTAPRPGGSMPAVVFSCGHHLPRRTLTGVMDVGAALGGLGMSQSATVHSSHYSRQGLLSVACPQCVLNTIRTS